MLESLCNKVAGMRAWAYLESGAQEPKIEPRTQDPGPSSVTLRWDPKMGPYSGALRLTLGQDTRVIIINTLFETGKIYIALQKMYSLIYTN